tara:strand:+ start:138 stop:467 length:330 start_codon:yes stop_codon:yes gene_type:complete
MFKKEINFIEEENKLLITISIQKRTYINQKKVTFEENIVDSIPEQFIEIATLVEEPNFKISNFTRNNHKQSGTWVFKINQEKEKIKNDRKADTSSPRRRKTRTSRTKKN